MAGLVPVEFVVDLLVRELRTDADGVRRMLALPLAQLGYPAGVEHLSAADILALLEIIDAGLEPRRDDRTA